MENEIKTRSIRADNDSFEKFKLISDEFPNQAQALAALISVYEVEKSKAILPERQLEIESFSSYIQKINEIYNHSLLLNNDAEIRIRAEFERKLKSKDITIQDLQEKLEKTEQSYQGYSKEKSSLIQENSKIKNQIGELEKEIKSLLDEKSKSDSIIKNLTEITTEYKVHAKENEALKKQISAIEKQVSELTHKNQTLVSTIEQQTLELQTLKENQVKEINQIKQEHEKEKQFISEKTVLEKNQDILTLKDTYGEKIRLLHDDYQRRIDELLKAREQEPPQKKEIRTSRSKKDKETEITASAIHE